MDLMSKIISLCKRRGFIFPSSEIYGGFGSGYDFGPLGNELKNNIKKAWQQEMLKKQDNIVGLDAGILMSPKVWRSSGHLSAGFADELVECKKCHKRFKMDEIETQNHNSKIETNFIENLKCPECKGDLTNPKKFNLMMKTFIGSLEDESSVAYLRPETCQGIYVNFSNVLQTMRLKIPFGIAQIGKSFRNEITPKNFIFRVREFEQMEMQWFCSPNLSDKEDVDQNKQSPNQWFDYWKQERLKWYLSLGIKKENLKFEEVPEKERAHYAKRQIDILYHFPFGWKEIEGIHNRGDYDLSNHMKHSGKDLKYNDELEGKKYIPYIIETSAGVERLFLAFLCEAYSEIKGGRTETTQSAKELESVLRLNKKLCPIKIAVLPLVKNKPELVKKAREVYQLLKTQFSCQYDESGSIGRRYRRGDEIGIFFAITIDFNTIKDNTITIRERDTMKQKREKIENLINILNYEMDFQRGF